MPVRGTMASPHCVAHLGLRPQLHSRNTVNRRRGGHLPFPVVTVHTGAPAQCGSCGGCPPRPRAQAHPHGRKPKPSEGASHASHPANITAPSPTGPARARPKCTRTARRYKGKIPAVQNTFLLRNKFHKKHGINTTFSEFGEIRQKERLEKEKLC